MTPEAINDGLRSILKPNAPTEFTDQSFAFVGGIG